MNNEGLLNIISDYVPDVELRQQLHDKLVEREDHALDHLRLSAATQGLMPSITAVILVQTGLGSPIDPATCALLQAQADQEVAELNEAIRRYREQQ